MHSPKLSSQTSTAEMDLTEKPAVVAELRCSCCCHYYRKLSSAQHMRHVCQFANLEVQSGEEEEEEEEKIGFSSLFSFSTFKNPEGMQKCKNIQ